MSYDFGQISLVTFFLGKKVTDAQSDYQVASHFHSEPLKLPPPSPVCLKRGSIHQLIANPSTPCLSETKSTSPFKIGCSIFIIHVNIQFRLPATLDHLRSGGNAEFRIMKFGG